MEKYDPQTIEPKWQEKWFSGNLYKTPDESEKPKHYTLVEFPYPSGEGLHIGHTFAMTGADVFARKKRMEGYNVLFPMGWDAFGLPTENYAIKTGIKPQAATAKNTAKFKEQMQRLGFSFDWDREINTTDPNYYKWTQWIFIQLFKAGLAHKEEMPINWCPSCKIGLANEEVINGKCERCGAETTYRNVSQWIVSITKYADRLLHGLAKTDFIDKVKKSQISWIGKSEGAKIRFKIGDLRFKNEEIEVFTTRPDTLWGATFLVLAPEHWLVDQILAEAHVGATEIRRYAEQARAKSELGRTELAKEKTGVFTGLYAINPANGQKIPIWISDFVLSSYGAGAIMAVPAHDVRDFEFARKYDLPIAPVIVPVAATLRVADSVADLPYTEYGVLINSDDFSGMKSEEAIPKICAWLKEKGVGESSVSYHLRDWIFSRQHYWGEPIPMIYCEECAKKGITWFDTQEGSVAATLRVATSATKSDSGLLNTGLAGWFPVDESDLPVRLPDVEKYQPTGTGESPLANVTNWVTTTCPHCGGKARRETDTMPNWAGSDWYFLAYCFASTLGDQRSKIKNQRLNSEEESVGNRKSEIGNHEDGTNIFAESEDLLKHWLPVDVYIGGDEHNTLHLLYSRFIYQFLWDLGVVPKEHPEPYFKRISHGVILGPDGSRMSKSKGNVVIPDDVIASYGADVLRLYLMFLGPFDATMAWDNKGVEGCARFLNRVWKLVNLWVQDNAGVGALQLVPSSSRDVTPVRLRQHLHRTIKKVSEDIDNFRYNTAIASMMEFVNSWSLEPKGFAMDDAASFLKILAPFAPYVTEELYERVMLSRGNGNEARFVESKKSSVENAGRVKMRKRHVAEAFRLPSGDAERDEPRNPSTFSIHLSAWPSYDPKMLEEEEVTIVVQVNGKLRGNIVVPKERSNDQAEVEKLAKEVPTVIKQLEGKSVKKAVFVPGKLINFVVS